MDTLKSLFNVYEWTLYLLWIVALFISALGQLYLCQRCRRIWIRLLPAVLAVVALGVGCALATGEIVLPGMGFFTSRTMGFSTIVTACFMGIGMVIGLTLYYKIKKNTKKKGKK